MDCLYTLLYILLYMLAHQFILKHNLCTLCIMYTLCDYAIMQEIISTNNL